MPRRQPVVQVIGDLVEIGAPSESAEQARSVVLAWLREKQRLKIPPQAEAGGSFNLDASEGQPLVVARFKNFWAMRLDKLDGETPGRIWRTEVSIGHDSNTAMAGVRLTVIDTAKYIRIPTSVPRVVFDLIDSPGIAEYGVKLSTSPVNVVKEEEMDNLLVLLKNPQRTRPVVIVAEDSGASAIEIADMASRLAGIAHIYHLSEQSVEWINERLGRNFAVSQRGLRTFNPKFDPDFDEISNHPPATIEWIRRRFGTIGNFVRMLLERFSLRTVSGLHAELGMPSVDQVEAAAVEARLVELAKQGERSERETLLEQQVARLERTVAEKSQEYDYAARCVSDAAEERDRYRAQLYAARQRVISLEARLDDGEVEIDIPDDFERLHDWALENFPGRLQLLSRAIRSAKKSKYEDKPLVYRCLARLSREYVDARKNGLPLDGIFESLGVQLERTGSRAHLSQWEEEYFFHYRNQNEFLEWHLKKGTGHNEETTLRIYFYYDEEDCAVIIGHLTSHLTNAAT